MDTLQIVSFCILFGFLSRIWSNYRTRRKPKEFDLDDFIRRIDPSYDPRKK